ncbi:MAG: pilus assembly protein [Anaerolineae bacterium]|nr:pilus assembly protein [Anaerolineae bacterium]
MFKRPHETGQGLVEYAFILVLVAVIVVLILAVVGTAVRDGLYENIIENI